MDNTNDNIFATGASGPQGEFEGTGVVPPVTVSGIEGRVDPVAARASSVGATAPTPTGTDPAATAEPVKRGRGRPRKNSESPITGSIAGTAEASDKNETPRNIRASFIERMLYSIHMGVAKLSDCPEFKLDEDDAKELGQAIAGVLALHKVKITPAQEAYSILFEAAAKIYPPMIVSVYVRKSAEAKGKGKVLNWPRSATPAPQPAPAQEPQKESVMPPGFDPTKVIMPE